MKAKATILSIVISISFFAFCLKSMAQDAPSSDTLQIPFIERFTEGSLEINNWVVDCENWSIESDSGNPAPSVSFNGQPGIYSDYNCALTSDWISTKNANSRISILFDYKLIYHNFTENDTLFIEVFDSINWHTVWKLFHPRDNWYHSEHNITSHISTNYFKIRFRASGYNSSNIDFWAIDNIFVYDGTRFSEQLEGSYYWDDDFGVMLKWFYEHPTGGWGVPITWSWGDYCTNLGLSNGGDWAYAAKWDSPPPSYNNTYLLRVYAAIGDLGLNQLFLNVWTGENGDVLLYSRNVKHEAISNSWNNFDIIEPSVLWSDTMPLWVGFVIKGQHAGNFPAGMDCDEAVNGYGNLIKTDLNGEWDTLGPEFGNWSIQLLFSSDSMKYEYEGYLISRKTENDTTYHQYDFLKDITFSNEVEYFDKYPNVEIQKPYSYQVRNAYINHWVVPEDTVFSLPAYAKIYRDEDFVTILVTHYPESSKKDFCLTTYPNPTTTFLNIKSESKLDKIFIYNLLGQEFGEFATDNEKQVVIDVSSFKKGVYLLKIETETGVVGRKFVVE